MGFQVLDPTNEMAPPLGQLAPRPGSLRGKTVGFISNLPHDLVEAFMSSDEAAMEVDVAKIGRKPETVRSALAKTIRARGLQDQARVSMRAESVILLRR